MALVKGTLVCDRVHQYKCLGPPDVAFQIGVLALLEKHRNIPTEGVLLEGRNQF